ncbi:MAG: hypothetical protein KAR42_05990 [candidate division Zixibacteria bacterium]|nr:hypothetical protein [candidate division Zixibacteria bacterium]
MDKKKNHIIVIVVAFVLMLLTAGHTRAELREWKSYTYLNEATDIIHYNGSIWAATTGGLIQINPDNQSFRIYTNVDGLETNRLNCLHVDDRNRLWVGGQGRLVNFTDPDNPDGYLFTDREGGFIDIYEIASVPGGDSLWLANQVGLTIFLPGESHSDGLILDTYNRFGTIGRDTPAKSVALDDDHIWVGSDGGLAVGSRFDIRQLKAPAGWTSFLPSEFSTLPNDSIKSLVIARDSIFIGTTAGAYVVDTTSPALTNVGLYGNPVVYQIVSRGDSLLIHSSRGSSIYYDGTLSYLPTEGLPLAITTCGVFDGNGLFWSGNLRSGVYWLTGGIFQKLETSGLPGSECRQVIHTQNRLWASFWSTGLAYLENGQWHKVDSVIGYVTRMEVGPLGELWVGTWGNGVYRILGESISNFKETNSELSGISEAPSFVVVADIKNSGDAIWFANLRGRDGEVVAVNPFDTTQWSSYILTGGSAAEWVETITVGQGTVYAGSNNNGIYARLYNGTPFRENDDITWRFTSSNSNIGSDIIRSLYVDSYDSLWAGTAFGLSFQSIGEIIFANETLPDGFGPEVTAITAGGRGAIYAGSNQGIAVRDIATGDYEHFTAQNSGLVDDKVFDIFYEKDASRFWIATAGGISQMTLPGVSNKDINNVLAYPNPFIIRFGNEVVRFNLAENAEVRIFTASGELIREYPVNGRWDGRNSSGELVASGLYLFTIVDSDGSVGRGKIFLIRE